MIRDGKQSPREVCSVSYQATNQTYNQTTGNFKAIPLTHTGDKRGTPASVPRSRPTPSRAPVAQIHQPHVIRDELALPTLASEASCPHRPAPSRAPVTLSTPPHKNIDKNISQSTLVIRPNFVKDPLPEATAKNDACRLKRPKMSREAELQCPVYAHIYNTVTRVGLPNYRGARVRVPSKLNIPYWEERLRHGPDPGVVDMAAFGWPIGVEGDSQPVSAAANYTSATEFPEAVSAYLAKEASLGAIAGPFKNVPFEPTFQVNPMMTREKKDSRSRRVITDLTGAAKNGVNPCIPRDEYDGYPMKTTLTNHMHLADLIASLGPGCYLSKIDLSRAYRQIPVDPLDWSFLGLTWGDGWYFDMAQPFGVRWGAMACQRTTNAVAFIANEELDATIFPFIDDMASACVGFEDANKQYTGALSILDNMGLEAASEKCAPPTTNLTWIGVNYDTQAMTMSIEKSKIAEVSDLCYQWLSKKSTTESELQKVLGKIFHAITCAPMARRFVNRLLDLLRVARKPRRIRVSEEAKRDLAWLAFCLPSCTGVSLIRDKTFDGEIAVDSCLTGGGGVSPDACYTVKYPDYISSCKFSISALECFNLLLAVRLWAKDWKDKNLIIWCDNQATVNCINSGRASDPLMRACIREFWFHCVANNLSISVMYIPGVDNEQADLMSRLHLKDNFKERLKAFTQKTGKNPGYVTPEHLEPPMQF